MGPIDDSKAKKDSHPVKESRKSQSVVERATPERRITPRNELDIELTVYGRSASGAPFYAQARVVRGNANGGLLLLAIPVIEGQDLLLINKRTSQEQICNIVDVWIRDIQMNEVSVSFPVPNPDFWKTSKSS